MHKEPSAKDKRIAELEAKVEQLRGQMKAAAEQTYCTMCGGERKRGNQYRKRPIVIEAVQWLGTAESWKAIMDMGDINWEPGEMGTDTFSIRTIDGNTVLITLGTWVCKGIKGEFYPCDPEIFAVKVKLHGTVFVWTICREEE